MPGLRRLPLLLFFTHHIFCQSRVVTQCAGCLMSTSVCPAHKTSVPACAPPRLVAAGDCPECFGKINIKARRCQFCCQPVEPLLPEPKKEKHLDGGRGRGWSGWGGVQELCECVGEVGARRGGLSTCPQQA